MSSKNHILTFLKHLVWVSLFLSGCSKKPAIEVYTIPKETSKALIPSGHPVSQSPEAQPMLASTMNITAATTGTPSWSAPVTWKAQPLGTLKKGAWEITGDEGNKAEVSVLVFPGNVGGDFKNINRWRQQIGLPSWDEPTFRANNKPLIVDDHPGIVVVLAYPESAQAIIGAIVPVEDNTWYFKMMGEREVVLSQKEVFLTFLSSVSFPK
jgi:hypothetical protein